MAPEVSVPGCATGIETGHDRVAVRFLRHPANAEYARSVAHRFQYTEIMNVCEERPCDLQALARDSPNAYIAHAAASSSSSSSEGEEAPLFFSPAESKLRALYWTHTGEWPPRDQVRGMTEAFEAAVRSTSPDAALRALSRELCGSGRYLRLALQNQPREPCVRLCEDDVEFRDTHPSECRYAIDTLKWDSEIPSDKTYVWSTDFHVSPIACSQPIFDELNAVVHAEIDFNNCVWYPEYCKKRLKVLEYDDWRGFSLDPCPYTIRRAFFDAYKRDPEFERVDLVVCSHPVANCELYMPFNRSIMVYATTRLEFGRDDWHIDWRKPSLDERSPARWAEWVQNLKRIASRPGNFVAANNMFDVHYIKYHTGIDALYVPSWCGSITGGEKYSPVRGKQFLLGPYRDNLVEETPYGHPIMLGLLKAVAVARSQGRQIPCEDAAERCFSRVRDLYPKYKWSDILQHPALVLIPYQVSTMFFFELYRTNMPMFVPSPSLLQSWVRDHGVLWERAYGVPKRQPHPYWSAEPDNPNSDENLEYWLSHSDFYVFPHVTQFDSWDDLLVKITHVDLDAISRDMAAFNRRQYLDILDTWRHILGTARMSRRRRQGKATSRRGLVPYSFDEAMVSLYPDYRPLPPDRPAKLNDRCRALSDPASSIEVELETKKPSRAATRANTGSSACFDDVGRVESAHCAILDRPVSDDPESLARFEATAKTRGLASVWQELCLSDEHLQRDQPSALCQLFCHTPEYALRHATQCRETYAPETWKKSAACGSIDPTRESEAVSMCRVFCETPEFSKTHLELCDPFPRGEFGVERRNVAAATECWFVVQVLYHSVLGRAPDANARHYQHMLIHGRITVNKFAFKLCTSREHLALGPDLPTAPECLAICSDVSARRNASDAVLELCHRHWQATLPFPDLDQHAYGRLVDVAFGLVLGRAPSLDERRPLQRLARSQPLTGHALVNYVCLAADESRFSSVAGKDAQSNMALYHHHCQALCHHHHRPHKAPSAPRFCRK